MHSGLGGHEEGIILCVYWKGCVDGEVKDSFTEGRLVELTIGHLPSEQVGKGILGRGNILFKGMQY